MAIVKYKFSLNIGFVTCDREEIVDFDTDDYDSEEELEKAVDKEWTEWIWNFIDGGAWKLEENE